MYKLSALLSILALLLCGCSWLHSEQDGAPHQFVDISKIHSPTPHPLPKSRYGNPESYVVNGKRYFVLQSANGYRKRGIASWYGTKFSGQITSSGEPYDLWSLTAASRTLPIPVYARVTNLDNGRSIIVKVNDRGPFVKNRLIDLSYAAAKKLGYADTGTARVEVSAITLDQDPLEEQHYLQVGSFGNKRNALALRSQLSDLTQENIQIHTLKHQHHPLYRVEIGPVAGRENSARLETLLRSRGIGVINRLG